MGPFKPRQTVARRILSALSKSPGEFCPHDTVYLIFSNNRAITDGQSTLVVTDDPRHKPLGTTCIGETWQNAVLVALCKGFDTIRVCSADMTSEDFYLR